MPKQLSLKGWAMQAASKSVASRQSQKPILNHVRYNLLGMGTLLLDLLTEQEEEIDLLTQQLRFDIPLLSDRVKGACDWVEHHHPESSIGIIGSSTGAASALIAAALKPDSVKAVVSRGGRPDLAGSFLPKVKAPTLMIVGSEDFGVIDLNKGAMAQMHCLTKLELVKGATHLFEEPGTLEQAASLAGEWFEKYL
jgi:pimeloyl-ACP methyl ester carboxylesterase